MVADYTLTANGTAGPVRCNGDVWVQASGSFGGGTLSVQVAFADTFVEEFTLTAAGQRLVELPNNAQVRFVLSGATSPNCAIQLRQ